MKLNIPYNKDKNKYLMMLNLFSYISPYSILNNREKQVLSELYFYDYELKGLDEKKRDKLIFDYDTRSEIAEKLDISTDSVYNIMSSLKKKDFILGKHLNRKVILPDVDNIEIIFINAER